MAEIILAEESYQIIRACVEVYDEMGSGFLEPIRAIRVIRGFSAVSSVTLWVAGGSPR